MDGFVVYQGLKPSIGSYPAEEKGETKKKDGGNADGSIDHAHVYGVGGDLEHIVEWRLCGLVTNLPGQI
jgi:hypothetical protein